MIIVRSRMAGLVPQIIERSITSTSTSTGARYVVRRIPTMSRPTTMHANLNCISPAPRTFVVEVRATRTGVTGGPFYVVALANYRAVDTIRRLLCPQAVPNGGHVGDSAGRQGNRTNTPSRTTQAVRKAPLSGRTPKRCARPADVVGPRAALWSAARHRRFSPCNANGFPFWCECPGAAVVHCARRAW